MAVRLTVKGKEYMLKLVAGEITSINFANMSIGSGGYSETKVADGDIINLKNIIVTASIHNTYTSAGDDSKSQLYVDATFQNDTVLKEFAIKEVGVFALDEDGNEYLYSYDILSDEGKGFAIMKSNSSPQYMPISLDTGLSDISKANLTLVNDLAIVNKKEFDRFKIDVDNKDAIILNTSKIYTDTSVSLKADSSHTHALTSSNISGVLPVSKGGTGRGDGDADFNTLNVQSLIIADVPLDMKKGMPNFDTPATLLATWGGYQNIDYTVITSGWYKFEVKGGKGGGNPNVTLLGHFIRYLNKGDICKIGTGGNGYTIPPGSVGGIGGGGSTTLLINKEIFDMCGTGGANGGGSSGNYGGSGGQGGRQGTNTRTWGTPWNYRFCFWFC